MGVWGCQPTVARHGHPRALHGDAGGGKATSINRPRPYRAALALARLVFC